jgi:hypothetical protein
MEFMSASENAVRLSALVAQLSERIDETVKAGEVADVPRTDLTALVSGAVKLYATAVEETNQDVPVIDPTVSTTEAMVVACALLRAHHLNPFDLALWFSRTAGSSR